MIKQGKTTNVKLQVDLINNRRNFIKKYLIRNTIQRLNCVVVYFNVKNYKEPIINRLTKLGYTKIRVCKEKIDVLIWNKPSLASFLHLQSSNTLTEILHMGLIGLTESLTRVHKRGPMAGTIFLFHPFPPPVVPHTSSCPWRCHVPHHSHSHCFSCSPPT